MIEYGLIGKKLSHSFSPDYFNSRFSNMNIPAEYSLYEIPSVGDFPSLIAGNDHLRGLNVTIPYKQEVIPYLNSMTPVAQAIGAVNTIRVERDDEDGSLRLVGHNTDAIGFGEAIRPLLAGRRHALVLGQGGASKAVEYALLELGVAVTKVSRTKSKDVLTYSDLTSEVMAAHDIIINCTPLGMWPNVNACPEIPYEEIDSRYLCFDLIYNPEETEFMKRCSSQGATVSNGLSMLHGQADAAYRFWNTREFISQELESAEIVRELSLMSRKILIEINDLKETYYLSIATLYQDSNGRILKISVTPYERELCNVEYSDSPLHFRSEEGIFILYRD
ncbi:MAG: shikimate dehydrogenase [Muribaculaceae bacterium]|nr:shikimate dehydrogenase [Muribaculaceae bacterium]